MIRRLLLAASLTACCLPAQFSLYVVLQDGTEALVSAQQGYDFGTVSLGDQADISFGLRNTGSSSATLTVFALAGVPDFSFVNPPAVPETVAAGDELHFTIRFRPSAPATGSSANFTADGVSVIVYGSALAAATISADDGSGHFQALMDGAPIDFGNVIRATTAKRHVMLLNQGADKLTIRNVAIAFLPIGQIPPPPPFQWKGAAVPMYLAAGASATMEVDFTPAANGPQQGWALEIDQRQFPLAGVGIDPPFPQPEIALTLGNVASAQQGQLTVRLPGASQATGTGQAQIAFHSSLTGVNGDGGIQFLSGGQTATFSVNQGDTVGHFGSQDSIFFQTGTTAGDIVFTVTLGDFREQSTLTIPPAAIGVDSTLAQRTSGGLHLQINAFDNTRSASKVSFTFFDQNGNMLNPGTITMDESTAFQQFFATSDLGGVFALLAFFPVTGDPAHVASVVIQMLNAAGTTRTQQVPFH